MRSLTLALVCLLGAAVAAQAPINFSGKWQIQGAGGRGGGGRGGQTLTLNQVGASVTGELLGGGGGGGGSAAPINNEIYAGKVDGNQVSFYVWRGTDKPYKVTYVGTMNPAGDEITFTVTGAPVRGGGGGFGGGPGRGQGAANAAAPAAAPATPAAPPATVARRVK